MGQEFIERLLSAPQRGQIQIDFNSRSQIFRLSIPIFSSVEGLPLAVKKYVETRKDSTFTPHSTSYHLEGHRVLLVQELPFALDFQSTLRLQVDQFWQMSQHCHKMLSEIAEEEIRDHCLNLDSHFPK